MRGPIRWLCVALVILLAPVRISAADLTPADKAALTSALRAFVSAGTGNADTDFLALRGKAHEPGSSPGFDADTPFTNLFQSCSIASALYPASNTTDRSHWTFTCTTNAIAGPKAIVAQAVHDAVSAALPPGFIVDQGLPGGFYRATRGRTIVSIGSADADGGVTFFANVYHTVPNQ
jgi:hypothetical protein